MSTVLKTERCVTELEKGHKIVKDKDGGFSIKGGQYDGMAVRKDTVDKLVELRKAQQIVKGVFILKIQVTAEDVEGARRRHY